MESTKGIKRKLRRQDVKAGEIFTGDEAKMTSKAKRSAASRRLKEENNLAFH